MKNRNHSTKYSRVKLIIIHIEKMLKALFVLLIIVAIVSAEQDEEGRRKKFKKLALLVPAVHGIVAVLVIIKIILAMGFIGFLSVIFHAFGGIRYLLARKEPEYERIVLPSHHSHEHFSGFDSSEVEFEHPGVTFKRSDLQGGRAFEAVSPYRGAGHSIQKRHLNLRKSEQYQRLKRSLENASDNCKKKAICELHARAISNKNPFYTFQLYFLKKDGIAQYWDHKDRTFGECAKVFPCLRRQ